MDQLKRIGRTSKEDLLVDETIFSVANGYLGIRGSFTEGYGLDYDYNQAYLNGLYDLYDYHYEENLSGFPQEGQRFVNLIDGQKIRFTFQKNRIQLATCNIISLERTYDLSKGYTKRNIHYQTKDKKYDFYIEEIKFVSRYIKELIGIEVKIHSPNYEGEIKVKSFLQEAARSGIDTLDPRVQLSRNNMVIDSIDSKNNSIIASTKSSGFEVQTTMLHNIDLYTRQDGDMLKSSGYFHILEPLTIRKYVVHTSNLYNQDIRKRTKEVLELLNNTSWEELLQKQEEYYTDFCDKSLIDSEESDIAKFLNYNVFQLNNSGGESDIHNISAKGLSGEGYEGHYFWDTEIYMIPFFILTNPLKAKNLLLYRYRTLDYAREEARELGYKKGAKIPWRTINGEETSPYYPAGSAQFHINSDVAYSVIKYIQATDDFKFLYEYGFELLLETARFLDEAINYHDGEYHLNSVTGPDEYTTVVDDNFYTNYMIQYHYRELVDFYEKYRSNLSEVIEKLHVTDEEIDHIADVADNIHLPFSKELNIFAQDRNFLSKKKLDLQTIPEDKFPLLLNFHPLYLYKHQVLKQADTVLGLVLLDHDDDSILEDSFNYYEPITTHDSSLSKCIYSIAAFRLKKYDVAMKYFQEVLETDYHNTHNNTEHGLHIANLGGSYLAFVYGLLGLRIHKDYLRLDPNRIKEVSDFTIKIQYKGEVITISLSDKLIVETTGKVKFKINDALIEVEDKYQVTLPN